MNHVNTNIINSKNITYKLHYLKYKSLLGISLGIQKYTGWAKWENRGSYGYDIIEILAKDYEHLFKSITFAITTFLMLLRISGVGFVCLEYQQKHGRLHQGFDYIVYLRYFIDFDCIDVVLNV